MGTLIISPDTEWSTWAQQAFVVQGLLCDVAHNGKEAQLKAYQKKYMYFVLDLEVQNHPGLEVCKYLRKACPQSKIIVTIPSFERLGEMLLDEKKLIKLGITKLLCAPSASSIVNEIQSIGQMRSWKNIQRTEKSVKPDLEETIPDLEFSRIKTTELFVDAISAFDYYLRISANKFKKVIQKGQAPTSELLDEFAANGSVFIFFLKKDRYTFISYQNDYARVLLQKSSIDGGQIIATMKSTTDKLFEELFSTGLQPNLIEEAKSICHNLYAAAVQDKGLKSFINDKELFQPGGISHSFLTALFSIMICKDLDWVGSKSIETLALGALLHDIGILQLPPELHTLDVELMNDEQKRLYQNHPTLGANALSSIQGINPGVIEIVLQHHECINGSGYPSQLTSQKIFPLAKVVALAAGFSYFIKVKELSPIEGLKLFLKSHKNVVKYDPDLITNLIKAIK